MDLLNPVNVSGLPPHELKLKVGAVVMLLRNLDVDVGECNGAKMKVTRLEDLIVECEFLTGERRARGGRKYTRNVVYHSLLEDDAAAAIRRAAPPRVIIARGDIADVADTMEAFGVQGEEDELLEQIDVSQVVRQQGVGWTFDTGSLRGRTACESIDRGSARNERIRNSIHSPTHLVPGSSTRRGLGLVGLVVSASSAVCFWPPILFRKNSLYVCTTEQWRHYNNVMKEAAFLTAVAVTSKKIEEVIAGTLIREMDSADQLLISIMNQKTVSGMSNPFDCDDDHSKIVPNEAEIEFVFENEELDVQDNDNNYDDNTEKYTQRPPKDRIIGELVSIRDIDKENIEIGSASTSQDSNWKKACNLQTQIHPALKVNLSTSMPASDVFTSPRAGGSSGSGSIGKLPGESRDPKDLSIGKTCQTIGFNQEDFKNKKNNIESIQSRPNQQFQQSRPPYQQFQQSRLPYQQYQQFQQSRPNQHFQQSQHQPHQSYWQNKSMQPGNAMPVKHNYPINQQAFGTPKNHSNTPYKPTPMSGISSIKTNLNFNESDITPRVYSYDSPFNNDRANPNNPFDINPINPNYDHPNFDHPNFDHPNYDNPTYDQNESEEEQEEKSKQETSLLNINIASKRSSVSSSDIQISCVPSSSKETEAVFIEGSSNSSNLRGVKLSNLADACDRTGVSDRSRSLIVNAVLQDLGVVRGLFEARIDPYLIKLEDCSTELSDFPKILYPDIVIYLVHTKSAFTMEEMKAYKSLEAYNQAVCGWVKKICVKPFGSYILVLGKIICKKEGSIISAHCDCVAGLGEVCTHVAAVLFSIDEAVRKLEDVTRTGVKAYWMPPSNKPVEPKLIYKMDLSRPKENVWMKIQSEYKLNLLSNLEASGTVLHLVTKPFSERIGKEINKRKDFHILSFYKEDFEQKSLAELRQIGEQIKIKLQLEDCEAIETETKTQTKCKAWFVCRRGRVTASKFKRCCRTNVDNPSISLIKEICYPTVHRYKIKALDYGCLHEKDAFKDFSSMMKETHKNFTIENMGLCISPKYPYFGASPDGIIYCDCCGTALLEIKCPYCARDSGIRDIIYKKSFQKRS
ncbi:hypothetical protein NQ314_017047 [Rhamnusium bicolor]|uniref:SWIM-type domain-containing protein n=1 Tax=Rhamnusium bicolor TaxID=1586634 RepID=A0AAV8WV15_9CUCU|nr:hypothetical protein NQ314_017047 [Rhamnusium bicolor]